MQRHSGQAMTKGCQAWAVGFAAVGVVIVGTPLIARSVDAVKNGVQEQAIARSPLLDQVLYRADEALDLHLTAQQTATIKPILAAAARRAMAIHQDDSLSPAAKRARLQALLQATRAQLLPIADREQRAKIESAVQRFTAVKLNLTAEQRAELGPIAATAWRQAQAVHGDRSLTRAQKAARVREIAARVRRQGVRILDHHQLQRLAGLLDTPVITNLLTRELNLTSQQRAQVMTIVADTTAKLQDISGDTALSGEDIQHQCYHALGGAQARINDVLTPEQRDQFDHLSSQVNRRLMQLG